MSAAIIRRVAAASLLAALPVGCTELLGIDKPYTDTQIASTGDAAPSKDADTGARGDGGTEDARDAMDAGKALDAGNAGDAQDGGDAPDAGDAGQAEEPPPFTAPADAGPITEITAGFDNVCALFSAGVAKCWGRNDYGQLGDGTNTDRRAPVESIGGDIAALFTGSYDTCAHFGDGGTACVGRGLSGELGNDQDANAAFPVAATGLPGAPSSIVGGLHFVCALIASTGDVWCVGDNTYGQLGNGTFESSLTYVQATLPAKAQALAATWLHVCALLTDGTVACWGANDSGQLGTGGVIADGGVARGALVLGLPAAASAVGAGIDFSCALVAGVPWCWGANESGQLGDGTNVSSNVPKRVLGEMGAAKLTVGGQHACVAFAAGGIDCWGAGGSGQLGNGATQNSNSPVSVFGELTAAAAITSGDTHTCALFAGSDVECWGDNSRGEIGNNGDPNTSVTTPTPPTW
jgi:alpha-tubulin suppressor-like RCC1 family protein